MKADDGASAAEVRESAKQLVTAFNAGKVDEVTAMFLPKGELIDEGGVVHQGQQEIKALLTAFYERFAGSKLAIDTESVRMVGPVAFDEGTRTITTQDGKLKSQFRYIAVWTKTDRGWRLVSLRDYADDPTPTPHERLQSIAWLVGDWINEGADGKVAISYRWSEDKNFLLGEFKLASGTNDNRMSTQRIGWDGSTGKFRSWLFDADGGFAEGCWTIVDDGEILISSSSVNPDGTTATATLNLTRSGEDRFTFAGMDRIIGNVREPDFELTVVRRPQPKQ